MPPLFTSPFPGCITPRPSSDTNKMGPSVKLPSTPKVHRYRDPAPCHHSHPLWNSDDRKEYKIFQRKEIYNTSPTLAVLPKDVRPNGSRDGKQEPGKMKSKLQGQLEIARKIDEKKERRRNKVKWLCVLRKSRRMQADSDPMKTKDEEDGSVEFSGKPVERKLFPKDAQLHTGLKSKQKIRARVGADMFTTGMVKDIPLMSPKERMKMGTKI